MTAKEKAKELQKKHLYCYLNPAYPLHDRFDVIQASEQALITVNEILNTLNETECYSNNANYWLDVRCELNTMIIGENE